MRTWKIIIIVILIGVSVWLYLGISAFFRAESDVLQQLDEMTQYYVSMDAEYVQPLAMSSVLSDDQRATLADISTKITTLSEAKNSTEQFENLLLVQRSIISFLSDQGLPEEFMSEERYKNWNTNASNRGEASRLAYNYNVALSLYNARHRTYIGKIASYWRLVHHRSYIGIDGTLQEETRISF